MTNPRAAAVEALYTKLMESGLQGDYGASPTKEDADWLLARMAEAGWVMAEVPEECTVGDILAVDADDVYNAFKRGFHAGWNACRADDWQPIETAPRDGTEVLVYAAMPDHLQWADPDKHLPPVVRVTAWHPDAGWCVDELREATHWCPLRPLSSAG